MTSHTRRLLLAFALLGLGASVISTYVHHTLLTDPTYTSFCDVSASVSCTQAYLSKYGSFLGAPVAVLGVIFFATIVLMVASAPAPRVVPAGKKVRAELSVEDPHAPLSPQAPRFTKFDEPGPDALPLRARPVAEE